MKKHQFGLGCLVLAAMLSAGCAPLATSPAADTAASRVTEQEIALDNVRRHLAELASDAYGGRAPLSPGEQKTIDYLAGQYRALGLEPVIGDSYLQPVPMAKVSVDQQMTLTLGDQQFANGSEFTARTQQIREHIALNDSPLVFVGYGINAPEYDWNDYAGVDVRGKTVVMLVNDPGFATQDPEFFKGNAMTYYGRWTYKYEEAARQGAAGAIIIHDTPGAGYPWSVVESSNTNAKFTLVDDRDNADLLGVMAWLHSDATDRLFAGLGLDFPALKQAASKPGFRALEMGGNANLQLNSRFDHARSYNVMAMLPGSERPDEVVVINAHWDHLGSKMTDEGLKIYNGAVDNASGSAGVVELARLLGERAKTRPFKRSILFTHFTAEETGMIGAQLFARQPPVPTRQQVALLNIDGMNVNQGVDYILQYGEGVSELEQYLADATAAQGRTVKPDPRPQAGLLYRSDHFALAQAGVPGLLFMSLGDTDPHYISHKYHKPGDDYDPAWSLGGVAQDLAVLADIAVRLANNQDWPKWIEDSDFKTRRARDGR